MAIFFTLQGCGPQDQGLKISLQEGTLRTDRSMPEESGHEEK
jgi:hypothetical protein